MTRNTTTRLAAANKQFQFCSGSEFLEIKRPHTCYSLTFLKVGGSRQLLSLDEASRTEYRPGAATSTGDSIRERQGDR